MESLKTQYKQLMADAISTSVEDLTDTEDAIICKSFSMLEDKLGEIKTLNDEIKRLNIELLNLKAMTED